MQFSAPEGYFDKLSGRMAASPADVDEGRSGYISGKELVSRSIPSEFKTAYYLKKADQEGTLDAIEEYLDPVGYSVFISETKSWLLGTSADVEVLIIDLSVLKLIIQGSQMGRISGKHTYEFVLDGNDSLKKAIREQLSEEIEEMHWAEKV